MEDMVAWAIQQGPFAVAAFFLGWFALRKDRAKDRLEEKYRTDMRQLLVEQGAHIEQMNRISNAILNRGQGGS